MIGPDAIERAALRVLVRRLGLLRALRVGLRTAVQVRRGAPFAHLPPASDPREQGSRDQAGPAIVLHRELRRILPTAEAMSIVAEVVEQGAVAFLSRTIGSLRRRDLERLDDEARLRFVQERGARFPNATLAWTRVRADEVRFTVTKCRLVELVAEAGHPELAPVFCAGDATFFGSVEPDVELIRPQTIAGGAPSCLFEIRYSADDT